MEEMPKEMQKEEGVGALLNNKHNQFQPNIATYNQMQPRPSQLAELSRSEFNLELFSHSAYAKFFITFATKVPSLTFCD